MRDRVCADHTIRHHSGVVRSESTVEMAVLQLLVHLTLQKNLQKTVDKKASDCYNNIRRQGRQPRKPKIWGISSAGRALAWHARGQRFDPAILHQKARYFAGSMVLFFLLKPIFWGCIASPAPFSKKNVCHPAVQHYNNNRIRAKTKWMPPSKFREASIYCSSAQRGSSD